MGAHVVRALVDKGLDVVVYDNLTTGLAERLPDSVPLIVGDSRDSALVAQVLESRKIEGIVHLAAMKHARESVLRPLDYWDNNVGGLLGVLQAAKLTDVRSLVFSSSCSIFGSSGAVERATNPDPQSPYARSKLACELLLKDFVTEAKVATLVLRYFNVIGNGPFPAAQDQSPECLVPTAFRAVMEGRMTSVFGLDHETPDGSSLRDYVDVRDVAAAHALGAVYVSRKQGASFEALNIGTGSPTSVLEVLATIGAITNRDVRISDRGRNPADPSKVWVADSEGQRVLSWTPLHDLRSSVLAHYQLTEADRQNK